jgi:outer membrane lipoprotein-sorting protein
LLDEKGVEVRGYRTTKAKGSTIRFRGLNVKIEVAKKNQTFRFKC